MGVNLMAKPMGCQSYGAPILWGVNLMVCQTYGVSILWGAKLMGRQSLECHRLMGRQSWGAKLMGPILWSARLMGRQSYGVPNLWGANLMCQTYGVPILWGAKLMGRQSMEAKLMGLHQGAKLWGVQSYLSPNYIYYKTTTSRVSGGGRSAPASLRKGRKMLRKGGTNT
ncbi:hypothetical protein AVEN_67249-1 [Araneus ventricosus]|uniref:Uncharacterized protein n=1 Tax=Araneus ventricosus TaxID=182803 RepID=A0A4Y2PY26_ARAVE|nr:hypothetical protein AVEN_67249-1 [Araneus ventricosus]